ALAFRFGNVGRRGRGERGAPAPAPVEPQLTRQLPHRAPEADAVHQLVEGDGVAALVAREAVEEPLLQVDGEARVSLAAVRVRGDGAQGLEARARGPRLG